MTIDEKKTFTTVNGNFQFSRSVPGCQSIRERALVTRLKNSSIKSVTIFDRLERSSFRPANCPVRYLAPSRSASGRDETSRCRDTTVATKINTARNYRRLFHHIIERQSGVPWKNVDVNYWHSSDDYARRMRPNPRRFTRTLARLCAGVNAQIHEGVGPGKGSAPSGQSAFN